MAACVFSFICVNQLFAVDSVPSQCSQGGRRLPGSTSILLVHRHHGRSVHPKFLVVNFSGECPFSGCIMFNNFVGSNMELVAAFQLLEYWCSSKCSGAAAGRCDGLILYCYGHDNADEHAGAL
jgi:hypothetical protein